MESLNPEGLRATTYVSAAQGWVYVAGILDLYSRRIVGWAVSQQINTALVMQALTMALCHRQPLAGMIFHSDRGVQYASGEYPSSPNFTKTLR